VCMCQESDMESHAITTGMLLLMVFEKHSADEEIA